jgi:hypothetical protein
MQALLKLVVPSRPGISVATDYARTVPAGIRFVLSALIVLGTAPASLAMAQSPAQHHPTYQTIVYGGEGIAPDTDRNQHHRAAYYEPTPAPFNAYTYSASAQLVASGSKRTLRAEFRFPVFKATPNVSVQIISSISATPMRVRAVKISEMVDQSGAAETQIIVEAEPIFDVPAGGFYFANLVVTGVPVSSPTASRASQLLP